MGCKIEISSLNWQSGFEILSKIAKMTPCLSNNPFLSFLLSNENDKWFRSHSEPTDHSSCRASIRALLYSVFRFDISILTNHFPNGMLILTNSTFLLPTFQGFFSHYVKFTTLMGIVKCRARV